MCRRMATPLKLNKEAELGLDIILGDGFFGFREDAEINGAIVL